MVCEHLAPIEMALLARNIPVTFRGQAWSNNCREWVYFDCFLDVPAIRAVTTLPEFVTTHSHRGTHDGQEHGIVCSRCSDAIMGSFEPVPGKPVFGGK
jgi:hypothetical protein